jgi:endonuclease YncB( thermonuclease family)
MSEINFTIPSGWTNNMTAVYIKTVDGDGLRVAATIRLWGLDAPEHDQRYGMEAQMKLQDIINDALYEEDRSEYDQARNIIRMEVKGIDRFGRILAKVFIGNLDVGRELVRKGCAWSSNYCDEEAEARSKKRGLWKYKSPENPADFKKRKGRKDGSITPGIREDNIQAVDTDTGVQGGPSSFQEID